MVDSQLVPEVNYSNLEINYIKYIQVYLIKKYFTSSGSRSFIARALHENENGKVNTKKSRQRIPRSQLVFEKPLSTVQCKSISTSFKLKFLK